MLVLATTAVAAADTTELKRFLERRQRNHGFSGVVLALRGEETVFEGRYGLADFELGVPFGARTKLRIGSVTKPFTAAAVLLLERAEKLSVSDSICSYLDPCPPAWRPVELRHLLTHTSGIPDLFEEVAEAPVEETVPEIDKTIAATEDLDLAWPPGERYGYSNFGYLLLGAVIEAASGLYYEDLLRQTVWEPLGLADTRYDRVWEIIEGRARGYTLEDGRLLNTEYDDPCAYSAGGLLSTPRDLARFMRAVVTRELLGEDATRRMLEPYLDHYAFGWIVAEHFGHPVVWHDGGVGGFSSQLAHYPDEDLTVVVTSNVENANAKGVACGAAAFLLGEESPFARVRRELEVPSETLKAFAGTYETEGGDIRTVTFDDGDLRYRGRTRLTPVGPGSFDFEHPDHYRIRFSTASDGRIEGFVIEECGAIVLRARRPVPADD